MFINKSLSNHIVEDGGDSIGGDGGPSHAQDSVETGGKEVHSQVSHFSKGSIDNRESTEGDSVL